MEQDTTAPEGAAFEPRPMNDILRSDAPARDTEPAGRQATEPPPAAPAETGDKPDAQPKGERPRDDAGRFAPKADAPKDNGPPPEPKQDAPQTVPVAAVLEERKKRQAVEARLKELEARLAAPPAPAAAPPPPAAPEVPLTDLMFQDPERFIQAVRAPVEDQLVQTRIALSEQVARQQPDYAEAEEALVRYAQGDPEVLRVVQHALRTHPTPALWALEQGRQLIAQQKWGSVIQQYGSPEAYLAAQQPPPAPQPASPPPPAPPASLASVRSAGPRSGAAPWAGPTPLANILGPRR